MRTPSRLRISRVAIVIAAFGCGDAASKIVPSTPLGESAKAWLFAHNRGDGHALVHYTLGNRGTGALNGAQFDSTVFDGVQFSKTVGPLAPTSLVESTDSTLTIALRSERGESWTARFTPTIQPSAVRVRVVISRSTSP